MSVREWPGDGRTVVLLHGLLDSSAGWDELARSSTHRCIAVDLPGFGRSDLPARARLSAYGLAVTRALDQLCPGPLTLVGHSLDGGVATALAERIPDRVAALVLCAPVGFGRLPLAELAALAPVRALAAAAFPHVVTRPFVVDHVYASLVTNGIQITDKLRAQLADDSARVAPGLQAAISALAAAGRSPRAFHRRQIAYSGPVSVLWGERDALVPVAHARDVVRALPQADVQIRSGMGHHPQREQPHTLAALVDAATVNIGLRHQAELGEFSDSA